MSRRKKMGIVQTRMQQMQISTKQLAQHIMQPETTVQAWLDGKSVLLYTYVWKACDFLDIDPFDLLQSTTK